MSSSVGGKENQTKLPDLLGNMELNHPFWVAVLSVVNENARHARADHNLALGLREAARVIDGKSQDEDESPILDRIGTDELLPNQIGIGRSKESGQSSRQEKLAYVGMHAIRLQHLIERLLNSREARVALFHRNIVTGSRADSEAKALLTMTRSVNKAQRQEKNTNVSSSRGLPSYVSFEYEEKLFTVKPEEMLAILRLLSLVLRPAESKIDEIASKISDKDEFGDEVVFTFRTENKTVSIIMTISSLGDGLGDGYSCGFILKDSELTRDLLDEEGRKLRHEANVVEFQQKYEWFKAKLETENDPAEYGAIIQTVIGGLSLIPTQIENTVNQALGLNGEYSSESNRYLANGIQIGEIEYSLQIMPTENSTDEMPGELQMYDVELIETPISQIRRKLLTAYNAIKEVPATYFASQDPGAVETNGIKIATGTPDQLEQLLQHLRDHDEEMPNVWGHNDLKTVLVNSANGQHKICLITTGEELGIYVVENKEKRKERRIEIFNEELKRIENLLRNKSIDDLFADTPIVDGELRLVISSRDDISEVEARILQKYFSTFPGNKFEGLLQVEMLKRDRGDEEEGEGGYDLVISHSQVDEVRKTRERQLRESTEAFLESQLQSRANSHNGSMSLEEFLTLIQNDRLPWVSDEETHKTRREVFMGFFNQELPMYLAKIERIFNIGKRKDNSIASMDEKKHVTDMRKVQIGDQVYNMQFQIRTYFDNGEAVIDHEIINIKKVEDQD